MVSEVPGSFGAASFRSAVPGGPGAPSSTAGSVVAPSPSAGGVSSFNGWTGVVEDVAGTLFATAEVAPLVDFVVAALDSVEIRRVGRISAQFLHNRASCEESIVPECVDFHVSTNVRYGGICEINARISDV